MKEIADDFWHWLFYDAPPWAFLLTLGLAVIFAALGALALGALIAAGYWIVGAITPAAAILSILHAYGKSKRGGK